VSEFEPTLRRLLPPASANERDVDDLEVYVRATIRWAMPHVTDPNEIADLVAEGFVIAEEIQRGTALDSSFRQALSARLANKLRDYHRAQHPEVRRNTRAKRKAAERGEEYQLKVYVATGLAADPAAWDREPLAPRGDVEAEVFDKLKLDALQGVMSARELMLDPQKAGLLWGVASYHTLATARAERAYEELEDLREAQASPRGFHFSRKSF
jgi:hypothetical protein